MRARIYFLVTCLSLLSLLLSACAPDPAPLPTAAAAEPGAAAENAGIENFDAKYEEEDCGFEGNQDFSGRIQCGALIVPEARGDPDSPTLRLGVVIFKSTGEAPLEDPLFVTFGPYFMGFSYFFGYSRLYGSYLDHRDMVILDPRGTGRSEISLDCPEVQQAYLDTLELEFNSAGVRDALVQAHNTCRLRGAALVNSIKNLNIVEMAEDFEDLRLALGYEKVNISALSTGARIAETWAARHPESIRSIAYITPVDNQVNIYTGQIQTVDRAIQTVFAECAANTNCDRAYPDLPQVFTALVNDLNAHPLEVEVNYLSEGTHYTLRLNGDRLIDLAYVMSSAGYADWLSYLPQVIYETKAGNLAPVAEAFNTYIDFTRPGAPAFSLGIFCGEILDEDGKAANEAAIAQQPPLYAAYFKNSLALQTAVCEVWGGRLNRLDIQPAAPLAIPVLSLTSAYDFSAPAEVDSRMAAAYTPAYTFQFSGGGGPTSLEWWDCWGKLETAFMNDPSIPPQDTCSQKHAPISWITFKP